MSLVSASSTPQSIEGQTTNSLSFDNSSDSELNGSVDEIDESDEHQPDENHILEPKYVYS